MKGYELPPLGWQKNEPFDIARWEPISNRFGWSVKPNGGLWTAPMGPEGEEAAPHRGEAWTGPWTRWSEWCVIEDWGNPMAPIVPIVPDPDANIYRIDDLADLHVLIKAFPLGEHDRFRDVPMMPNVDWEKTATEYDAVYLTHEGQWRTRFTTPSLYGWDCATVLWLQPRFTAMTEVA